MPMSQGCRLRSFAEFVFILVIQFKLKSPELKFQILLNYGVH